MPPPASLVCTRCALRCGDSPHGKSTPTSGSAVATPDVITAGFGFSLRSGARLVHRQNLQGSIFFLVHLSCRIVHFQLCVLVLAAFSTDAAGALRESVLIK
jgi:hypothetical protein